MAAAQQIRNLITQTTSGTARLRVPREVLDEVSGYATRRRGGLPPARVIDLSLFTNHRRSHATSSQQKTERKTAMDFPATKLQG